MTSPAPITTEAGASAPAPLVLRIEVPSGQLLIANDLRSSGSRTSWRPLNHFDIDHPMSLNYKSGLDAYAQVLAEKVSAAYAFVGNTCPSVVHPAPEAGAAVSSLSVVTLAWGEEADEEVPLGSDEVSPGSICTDLWAVMLTDYASWLEHGGDAIELGHGRDQEDFVLDVVPGAYEWTIYSHADDFDQDAAGRVVYATLSLVETA